MHVLVQSGQGTTNRRVTLTTMTQEEHKRLKGIQAVIAEQLESLSTRDREVEDRFAPIEKSIADLLTKVKKRISDRDGGQLPPLNNS
jgi:hypothetical protein